MSKRAHKILGVELRNSNLVRVTDPVGRVDRVELSWSSLSGAQQAALATNARAKRRLGQTAVS